MDVDRIARPHIRSGIEVDWERAIARAASNDTMNGMEIRDRLLKPSVTIQSVDVSSSTIECYKHCPAMQNFAHNDNR